MAIMEQPTILSRINRLDNAMRHLEEMRGNSWRRSSSSTGSPSTCSDGRSSTSPRSLQENYNKTSCRPMDEVISETEHKGTLLHRLSLLEDRVLEVEKEMEQHNNMNELEEKQPHTPTKKSFKKFVKSCVKPISKSKITS